MNKIIKLINSFLFTTNILTPFPSLALFQTLTIENNSYDNQSRFFLQNQFPRIQQKGPHFCFPTSVSAIFRYFNLGLSNDATEREFQTQIYQRFNFGGNGIRIWENRNEILAYINENVSQSENFYEYYNILRYTQESLNPQNVLELMNFQTNISRSLVLDSPVLLSFPVINQPTGRHSVVIEEAMINSENPINSYFFVMDPQTGQRAGITMRSLIEKSNFEPIYLIGSFENNDEKKNKEIAVTVSEKKDASGWLFNESVEMNAEVNLTKNLGIKNSDDFHNQYQIANFPHFKIFIVWKGIGIQKCSQHSWDKNQDFNLEKRFEDSQKQEELFSVKASTATIGFKYLNELFYNDKKELILNISYLIEVEIFLTTEVMLLSLSFGDFLMLNLI